MKEKVEQMLSKDLTNREKAARASAGAFGFCMFGDNVGKVINPRCVLSIYCTIKTILDHGNYIPL